MKSLGVCENAREAIEKVEWSALTSGLYAVEAHEGHGRSAVDFLFLEGEVSNYFYQFLYILVTL